MGRRYPVVIKKRTDISLFHFRSLLKGYVVKTNAFYSVISLLKVPKNAFSSLVDWLRNDGYESI